MRVVDGDVSDEDHGDVEDDLDKHHEQDVDDVAKAAKDRVDGPEQAPAAPAHKDTK